MGILEKVENGRVYTFEGNSGDSCQEKSYPIGWYEIWGMVCWRIIKVYQHVVNILCHGDYYIYCRLQETRQSIKV